MASSKDDTIARRPVAEFSSYNLPLTKNSCTNSNLNRLMLETIMIGQNRIRSRIFIHTTSARPMPLRFFNEDDH